MIKLHAIGRGACGTVWACETGPAYKREDGNPARSLQNDFEMHNRVLQSRQTLMNLRKSTQVEIQIPSCHNFIEPKNKEWWAAHLERVPQGYTSCNMIEAPTHSTLWGINPTPSYSSILPGWDQTNYYREWAGSRLLNSTIFRQASNTYPGFENLLTVPSILFAKLPATWRPTRRAGDHNRRSSTICPNNGRSTRYDALDCWHRC